MNGDLPISQSVIFIFDFSPEYAVKDPVFKIFERSYSMKVEVKKIKGSVAFFILEMVIIFAPSRRYFSMAMNSGRQERTAG